MSFENRTQQYNNYSDIGIRKKKTNKLKNRQKKLSKQNITQHFKIHDDLCSVKLNVEYFTNMIENLNDSEINNIIKEIFDVDGKSFENQNELPFSLDEQEKLIIGEREKKILLKTFPNFNTTNVLKCHYRNSIERMSNMPAKSGTNSRATRIYCILDENDKNNKIIILIDQYHLFATTQFKKNFKKCKGYNICMKNLKTTK